MEMENRISLQAGDALAVIDIQLDFLPGGSLAVSHGDEVIPVLNCYIDLFQAKSLPVFATRDWHPENHCSFVSRGGPWPPHCVQGSPGARFSPDLRIPADAFIISKATNPDREEYSDFGGTGFHEHLRTLGVKRLFVGGLATDYCVLHTVRDALSLGYEAFLLVDAVRAVDVKPGDGERAVEEMARLGAAPVSLEQVERAGAAAAC